MKTGRQTACPRPASRTFLPWSANLGLIGLTGLFLLAGLAGNHAEQTLIGQATDFTSDEYFEPPNQQRVKMRLTGELASPLPGGTLDITQLQIQTFNLNGATQAVVIAPQCIYAPYDGLASSPGHLQMQTADGKILITGDGFLWRQSDNSLTISNDIHTVIKMKALPAQMP
jgi:hypothetical protein